MNLIDFIHESNCCKSIEELCKKFVHFINEFELEHFMISELSFNSTIKIEKKSGVLTNYPDSWMEKYIYYHYANFDPVYQKALRSMNPFTWEEALNEYNSDKSIRIMNEAKKYNLCSGLGLPIYLPGGRLIGIGLSSPQHTFKTEKNSISLVYSGSYQFLLVYTYLTQKVNIDKNTIYLTDREKEVLNRIASGKTKSETADLIYVSESCVKRHCESIFDKLNVNKLPHAVAKAMYLGLIHPF